MLLRNYANLLPKFTFMCRHILISMHTICQLIVTVSVIKGQGLQAVSRRGSKSTFSGSLDPRSLPVCRGLSDSVCKLTCGNHALGNSSPSSRHLRNWLVNREASWFIYQWGCTTNPGTGSSPRWGTWQAEIKANGSEQLEIEIGK